MKATFVSVWDGGYEVKTNCIVDIDAMEVVEVGISDIAGLEVCERQYVVFPDGSEFEVDDDNYALIVEE